MELEKKRAVLVRAAYYALGVLVLYLAVRYLAALVLPFLLGLLVAYVLRPVAAFICRHSKISRRSASIVSAVVFYLLLGGLLWTAGAVLVFRLDDLFARLPYLYRETVEPVLQTAYNQVSALAGRFAPGREARDLFPGLSEGLHTALAQLSETAMGWLMGLAKAAPLFALTAAFTVISSVLICADYSLVTRFVMAQIPTRLHKPVLDTRNFLMSTLFAMVKAYVILMFVTFAELSLGLWILKTPRFLLVAAVIAVLDLLPVLGSGAVLIPWALYRLFQQDLFAGVGLLVLWAVISAVRQVLEPKIIGNQIGLHPLVTLTAMYCGWRLAGFGGLILAPILCLLVKYLQDNGLIKVYKPLPPS